MRLVVAALAVLCLSSASDHKCTQASGCDAQINRDGELVTVSFRKGDFVSTEDGWVVSGDDGWVKIDYGRIQQLTEVYLWTPLGNVHLGRRRGSGPVGVRGAWREPVPLYVSLVGVKLPSPTTGA